MSNELKPCPFCGKETAHIMHNPKIGWATGAYKVTTSCHCLVLPQWWETEALAIAAWNIRFGEPAQWEPIPDGTYNCEFSFELTIDDKGRSMRQTSYGIASKHVTLPDGWQLMRKAVQDGNS